MRPNYYHIFSAFDHTLYTLPYNFTMMYTFCGYTAVVLVGGAILLLRNSKLLAICFGLFAFSGLWMLGQSTPIYPVIFHRLPHLLQGSIYAEDALLGFTMFAAIVSALTVAHFQQKIAPPLLWLLALGTAANLIAVGANRVMNTANGSYKTAIKDSPGDWLGGTPRQIRKWLNVRTPPMRTDLMQQDPGWLRYDAEAYRLPTAGGDNPFMLLRYYRFRRTWSGDLWWSRRQFLRNFDTKWIDAFECRLSARKQRCA